MHSIIGVKSEGTVGKQAMSRMSSVRNISAYKLAGRCVASQFFLVSPEWLSRDHFVCPVPSFSEMKEIRWRKNAKVSEKLVSPGLPGLQVASRLAGKVPG